MLKRFTDQARRIGFGGNALTLMDQTQEDMFRTDVIEVQHAFLFLGKHNCGLPVFSDWDMAAMTYKFFPGQPRVSG